ncbi:restriction endonuclease subunit S [Anaerobiospirillum succiniciproducens]|uniref:restriction endonuclease subunit S n=1 Tax=Anaerobiospirillum succiniciproducens TaxID=13335 RepID=UPI00248D781B|nr:restriction endonuclease subunit S [Anaerobiospirillum succiniciproducens]
MNAAQLKASILQQAIEGKLVPQLPEEGVVEQIGDVPTEVPFEIPASWKWVTIKNIVVPTKQKIPDKDFTYIDVSCISSFSVAQPKFISADKAPSRARKIVHPGMLLYATVRPYLKNICIAPEIQGDVIASTAFATFECNAIVFNRYLFYVLISDYMSSYAKSVQKGISYPAINDTDFYKTLIPLPPFEEQKRIVAKIEELMPLVEEYGKAYDKLQELNDELPGKLKASILQEAIQGKLVPQLPEDGVVDQIGDAPAEVPFELPASWKWVPLVELTKDMADGPFGSNLKKEHYTNNKEVRIIQLSNIGENGWRNDNVKYTTYKHAETIARSKAKAGDIVIAKMMPAGRSVIVPELDNAYILSSDAVKAVVNTDLCINTYLNYAINSTIFKSQVYSNVQGTTRIRTSLTKLKNYLVPLPPLAEQKRIVAKLETLLKQVDMMIK